MVTVVRKIPFKPIFNGQPPFLGTRKKDAQNTLKSFRETGKKEFGNKCINYSDGPAKRDKLGLNHWWYWWSFLPEWRPIFSRPDLFGRFCVNISLTVCAKCTLFSSANCRIFQGIVSKIRIGCDDLLNVKRKVIWCTCHLVLWWMKRQNKITTSVPKKFSTWNWRYKKRNMHQKFCKLKMQ